MKPVDFYEMKQVYYRNKDRPQVSGCLFLCLKRRLRGGNAEKGTVGAEKRGIIFET